MHETLGAQYRRDLEAQLEGRDVRVEMERLADTYPVFRKYPSIEELCTLVGPGNRNYADKDAVLSALLVEIKRKPTLFALLNTVFWDNLMSIFHRKRRSVPNPDELFSRIQADFFHTAFTYPLDRRPQKINANLYWDTWKKVGAWQREEASYHERHKHYGQTAYCNRHEDPRHKAIFHRRQKQPEPVVRFYTALADLRESEVFPEEIEAYLLGLLYRQVIDESQYDLLLETEVYKRMSPREWAKARGVEYATARSWRHRAEAAIQKYEEGRRRQIGT